MQEQLMRRARDRVERRLAARGYSDAAAAEAVRSLRSWFDTRLGAARRGTRIVGGSGIVASGPGRAELVPFEVALAGSHEITVEVDASVVSPGTERAQYLRLPNAQVEFPYRPGYSAAGRVVAVGRRVRDLHLGDVVAIPRVSHASVATVNEAAAYRVPSNVPVEDAAFVYLAMISGYGLRRASLEPEVPFGVVGYGVVGALAQRLARVNGAGAATVIATSRRREGVARAGGAHDFLVAAADAERIRELRLPVVVEATGSPSALVTAVAAAGEGGRIVVLGSPRGAGDFPMLEVRRKRLEIVGAHISALAVEARASAGDPFRELAESFLAALATGAIQVADLVDVVADPREAAAFYRRLAVDPAVGGARFDWTLVPAAERRRAVRFVGRPSLGGEGLDSETSPLPPPHTLRTSSTRIATTTAKLRIGLLGCGEIGVQNARAVADARNAELVACFDPTAELADDVAARFGGRAYRSASESLSAGVDAVFIAAPHDQHAPLALEAVDAGLHVIVEKPLARDLEEAGEIVLAARRAGVALSISFPYRYEAHVVAARRLIEEGALGEPAGTLVSYAADKPPSYWLGGYSSRAVTHWRASRARAGGGVLIMNLCHYLDLVRHVADLEADTVTATIDRPDGGDSVEETIALAISYAGGAVGAVLGSSAMRGSAFSELRLWGDAGHVLLEPHPRVYTLRSVDGLRPGRWHVLPEPGPENVRTTYVERFVEAVRAGDEPDVGPRDALAVQAFMEAAYESADRGQAVRPADLLAGLPT